MVNKNPSMDWAIGDTCWYADILDNKIRKGIVLDVFAQKNKIVAKAMDKSNNVRLLSYVSLFRTKADADTALMAYLDEKEKAKERAIAKYRSQIKTVRDLVEFGYDNGIGRHTEDDDPNARAAFIAMAKELLDLDLDG